MPSPSLKEIYRMAGQFNPSGEVTFKRLKGYESITSAATAYTSTITFTEPVADGIGLLTVGNAGTDETDTLAVTIQGSGESSRTVQASAQDTSLELREGASTNVKLANKFVVASTIEGIPKIGLLLKQVGSVSGNVFITLEADSSGDPSGTALHTSANVDASTISTSFEHVEFTFAVEPVLTAATYWIVLQGTYTASASVNIEWGVDTVSADGLISKYDGTNWSAVTTQSGDCYIDTRDYTDLGSFGTVLGDDTYASQTQELALKTAYPYIRAKLVSVSGNSVSMPVESIVVGYPSKTL